MNKNTSSRVTRVLVVDDNADMRLTMKLLLEHEGYEVELGANGREALEVQRARPSQVLITDLFMPDADGFETIERFRKEFPQIRIIAMSGGGSSSRASSTPSRQKKQKTLQPACPARNISSSSGTATSLPTRRPGPSTAP